MICGGIFRQCSRPTVITQICSVSSKPRGQFLDLYFGCFPSLTNMPILAIAWACMLSLIPLLIFLATDLRTSLCLKLWPPWPNSLERLPRMCATVPFWELWGPAVFFKFVLKKYSHVHMCTKTKSGCCNCSCSS